MQLASCVRGIQPARCLLALSYRSFSTTYDEPEGHQQESAAAPGSSERTSAQQPHGTAPWIATHVPPGQDLEQPTAAEAAREEEEYGLNTPAPGKGDDDNSNTDSSSGSSSYSQQSREAT